ncbi:MAG: T9SS type A sorting domain-containing protein [Candidatus Azobacteroides sp.]|nr:T9SS type A sorting domain-containing protein [Candidatus Azobacteroides sp.]
MLFSGLQGRYIGRKIRYHFSTVFDLYLEFNTGNGFFYLDNIRLKRIPDISGKSAFRADNNFYYSDSVLYMGNTSADNISVFDAGGNLLLSRNNISSSLDISGLKTGVYLVKITTNEQIYYVKVNK